MIRRLQCPMCLFMWDSQLDPQEYHSCPACQEKYSRKHTPRVKQEFRGEAERYYMIYSLSERERRNLPPAAYLRYMNGPPSRLRNPVWDSEYGNWREGSPPAATAQPAPTGEGTPITPLVVADIQARSAAGEKKYGTVLRASNGRDALMDAYQEALDLCQYLRQALYERDGR